MKLVSIQIADKACQIDGAGNRDHIHIYNAGPAVVCIMYDSDANTATADVGTAGSMLQLDAEYQAIVTDTIGGGGFPIPVGGTFQINNDGNRNTWNKPVYGYVSSLQVNPSDPEQQLFATLIVSGAGSNSIVYTDI